jgi:hypothetical protein
LQERGEILLLNLLIPLILHVGGGMKDIPKLRKSDIIYSLNLILSLIQVIVVSTHPTRGGRDEGYSQTEEE